MNFIKRVKWPGWIILILLVILIVSGIYQFDSTEGKTASENKQSTIEAVATVTDNISKYPGLNLRTESIETKAYTMSISIPTAESEAINKPIHEWIEQQKSEFLKEIEKSDSANKNKNIAHLNIQVNTEKVTNNIYSLLFTSYEYLGGANGEEVVKPFTMEVENGTILQLSDLMNVTDKSTEKIQTLIKGKLKEDEEVTPYIMEDLLDESLKKVADLKWLLSKTGLTIYFNQYEIAAGAAGVIEVEIPLEHVQDYINDNLLKEWQVPKQKQEKKEEVKQEKVELDPDGKYIALTFDDGPGPNGTPQVLKTLKKYKAKATFFLLGNQAEYYPAIAEQIAKEGHEIANHSNSHPDLTKLSNKAIEKEMQQASEKIERATGTKPTLFRPPYGAYNDGVVQQATKYDNSIILWSVDSQDWSNRDANKIYKEVINGAKEGAIVLMHDIYESTADALPKILATLSDEGYTFITVSELLAIQEQSGIGPHFGKSN